MLLLGGDGEKFFCRKCAGAGSCFCCLYPSETLRTLDDGRRVCENCSRDAVFDENDAREVFSRVRVGLENGLGLSIPHKMGVFLADAGQMRLKTREETPGEEFGLFLYEKNIRETVVETLTMSGRKTEKRETVSERYSIYALSGLPRKKLEEVFAHELAHAWMQANYPSIKDLRTKEGWAEYVAWRMNKIRGREEMNARIEKNPGEVYGGGFRSIRAVADKGGMEALRGLFESAQ